MSVISSNSDSTCWTLIRGAAAGREEDREDFARRYVAVVRAYLAHRWRASRLIDELDDVVQEVFLECFRQGGVLDRIVESQPGSFRAFLYGVTRNVALRCEKRIGRLRNRQPSTGLDSELAKPDEVTLSRVFDRAWARTLLRQAANLQEDKARRAGPRARRRVELLRIKSRENLPIREIARRWEVDTAQVHKDYARARKEFKAALEEILSFHHPACSAAEIEEKCVELLGLLSD